MYSLCIVESPAKCGKIQGFLGPGWKVVATMGHIRALEETVDAVGLDRDFQPRYTFIKEKGKAMSGIKEAAKSAHTVYLAADDDREGEAIAYSVALLLGLEPAKTPRAVFHEITKEAVTRAVANPRRLDMNRVDAQQARAVLDMMVGFTISPILWKCVGPALSAGRCQTPALRLLVDREREITTFSAQTSWRISGNWTANSLAFPASLYDELEDEESAKNFLENIHADTRGEILSTKTSPRTAAPPKPLITSTLQQEASAIFSYQPKSTMRSAQKLYEQGHITYMRTDSTYISEEATAEAQEYIKATFGAEYVGKTESQKKGKQPPAVKTQSPAVKTQDAHEAIRPTHMDMTDLTGDWTPADIRIYKLIWQRTIQSVMAPALSEDHTVLFKALADPGEFIWQSIWKRSIFPGWKKVGLAAVNLDDEDEEAADSKEAAWVAATKLKTGDALTWKTLSAHPHETKPTGRYTEATLVRELERRGIGRPSTFASLVGTILEKEYTKKEDKPSREVDFISYHLEKPNSWPPTRQIEKKKVGAEKQKLSPTPLGTSVHDFCIREFPQLFDYGFTKKMEDRLDLIATGSEPWKGVCRDTWDSYKDKLEDLKKNGTRAPRPKYEKDPEETVGDIDGNAIIKKKGPYGFYLQWGTTRVPYVEGDTLEAITTKLKAKSESLLHILGPYEFRRGPYGVYMMMKSKSKAKPVFVSIPQELDPKILTEEAAARIYKTGLSQRKK
jgi:DNA topoisomerase I